MHTVKAIILKSIPHSEQQQILHVYSEERGYMQMITPVGPYSSVKRTPPPSVCKSWKLSSSQMKGAGFTN